MTTTNQQTTKTYAITSYEFSVIVRAILETMRDQNHKLTDRFRSGAPWESVLELISQAQIDSIKEAQIEGEIEKLLENFTIQQATKNN
jgi:hypothetical protein